MLEIEVCETRGACPLNEFDCRRIEEEYRW